MRPHHIAVIAVTALCSATSHAQTTLPYGHTRAVPSIRAAKTTGRINIDGKLTETDWAPAPIASDFRQIDPDEGAPAKQRTEVRFLFDGDALYVGARLYSPDGARGVQKLLARRDAAYDADWFEIALDTYHDHVRRVFLSVTPSGARNDETAVGSACCDPGWDPVWEVATSIDEQGWIAEFRIPLSQLRMPTDSAQVWGLQLKRVASKTNETSLWAFWRRTEPGGAPHYGHLEGLVFGSQPKHFELVPYVVGRSKAIAGVSGNPFSQRDQTDTRIGADFKFLVTPNLTLTGTVNPDFGQVEVDPAVVNLSAFETFFAEKRPFFVEGVGAFRFGRTICTFCSNFQSIESFYSRRIGRAPTATSLASAAGPYADIPEASTIVGAAKLTGRTRSGLAIGLLDAVTRRERATVQRDDGSRTSIAVEPAANYFVARVTADHRSGNVVTGAFASSVIRSLTSDMRPLFNEHAEMVGTDLETYWKKRRYSFIGSLMSSSVAGDARAITARQRASARYFQRPDGNHRVDSSATALRGIGAYARLAKDAGDWTWEAMLNTRSPGYEVNDIAFQSKADFTAFIANSARLFNKPTSWYQRAQIMAGGQYERNYQGLGLWNSDVHVAAALITRSFWNLSGAAVVRRGGYDDRLLRGGPAVRVPAAKVFTGNLATDPKKHLAASIQTSYSTTALSEERSSASFAVTARPRSNVSASLGPSLITNRTELQYVTAVADPTASRFGGTRYVLAGLDQRTASLDVRTSVTVSPTLSIEVYAQPFIAAGRYSRFKEFAAPRSSAVTVYGDDAGTITRDGSQYTVDPDGEGPAVSFSLSNPDFNRRSLRGNAVIRWEYRPGSTLYLVWTQSRSSAIPDGTFDVSRDADAMFAARPDNIFLIKASWWFNR